MKNYLSGKRQVARTHFKALLILGLLASNAAAQQPVFDAVAMPPLPAVPELSPAVELPVLAELPSLTTAPTACSQSTLVPSTWTARQHATWILGLRARTNLRPAYAELPSQVAPLDRTLIQPPKTTAAAIQPSPAASVTADIALPGPSGDTMVVPVQFVDNDLPQVPESIRAATTAPVPPSLVTHAVSESEPSRVGTGPIIMAPVAPLPLEDMSSQDSLLSVDTSGIDARGLDAPADQESDDSLIDGLVMPGQKTAVKHSLSDDASDEAETSNITMHEGFAPRKADASTSLKLSDNSPADESTAPKLIKSTATKVAVSLSDTGDKPSKDKVVEPTSDPNVEVTSNQPKSLAGRPQLLTPPAPANPPVQLATPPRLSLSDKDDKPADKVQSLVPPTDGGSSLSLNDKDAAVVKTDVNTEAPEATPAVNFLAIDEALAALAKLPLPEQASSETKLQLLPAPEQTAEKTPALLPAQMIAESAPPQMPIVAAQRLKLPEPTPTDRETRPTPSVKTASASMPSQPDDEPAFDPADEDVNYSRMAAKLQSAVKQKFPDSRIRVSSNEDGLVVEGTVKDSNEATKVMAFVRKTSLCPAADRLTCKR